MAVSRYADIVSRLLLLGFDRAQMQLTGFQTGLMTLSTRAAALAKSMLPLGGVMATALAGATVVAAKFEKQMASVSLVLKEDAGVTIKEFRKDILDMSKKYGEGTAVLAAGLKDILGADYAAAKSMDMLEVSAKVAAIGIADVGTATDVVITFLKSYELGAERAGEVADKLYAITKAGRIEFGELGSTLGKITAYAKESGVSLDDLGTMISVLSSVGVRGRSALQAVTGVIEAFQSPSEEAAEVAKSLGFELSTTSLRALGLTGVMAKLQDATEEELGVMFGSGAALRALVVALRDATLWKEKYRGISESAGLVDKDSAIMLDTLEKKAATLKQTFLALAVAVGDPLIPTVKRLTEGITNLADKFDRLDEATKKSIVTKGLWTAKAYLAVMTGAALVGSLGFIIAKYTLLISWIAKASLSLGAFSLGMGAAAIPVGAMVIALGGLAIVLGKCVWQYTQCIKSARELNKSNKLAAEMQARLGGELKEYLPYIVKASKYKVADLCGDPRKVKNVEKAITGLILMTGLEDKAVRAQAKSQMEAMENLLESHHRLGGCVEELANKQIDSAKRVGRVSEEEMKRRLDLAKDIVRERSSIEDELLDKIKDIEEEKANIRREIADREIDREVVVAKSRELATGEAKKYWEEIEDIMQTADILGESYARGDLERKSDALKEWISKNEGAQYALQKIGLLGGDVEKERMEERLTVLDKEKSETRSVMDIRLKSLDEVIEKEKLINEILMANKALMIGPGGRIAPSFYQESKIDVEIDTNIEKVGEEVKGEVAKAFSKTTEEIRELARELARVAQARGE